jgi:hypothetical protein
MGQTSILPAGFESAIPASEQPHTHALGGVATGIGMNNNTGGGGGKTTLGKRIYERVPL